MKRYLSKSSQKKSKRLYYTNRNDYHYSFYLVLVCLYLAIINDRRQTDKVTKPLGLSPHGNFKCALVLTSSDTSYRPEESYPF